MKHLTRREFGKAVACGLGTMSVPASCAVAAQEPGSPSASCIDTKAPRFSPLPIGAVKPRGWLKLTMQKQAAGITGNLQHYRSDIFWNAWDNRLSRSASPDWWPYEQQAYWADGIITLAYTLDDAQLKQIADDFVTKVLASQKEDGYIGGWPSHPYTNTNSGDIYVQGQLMYGLMSYFRATKDPRIIPAMQKALQNIYANCKPVPDQDGRLPDAWRGGSADWPIASHIIAACLWVYSITGDQQIMELVNLAFRATQEGLPQPYHDNTATNINIGDLLSDSYNLYGLHGVDTTVMLRIPALHYLYSGNQEELRATLKGVEKVDRCHGHVHGGPVSEEDLGMPTPLAGVETCDLAEWSITKETLFAITGDVGYADAVERILFNAFPGSTKPDGRAMQYFSYPNAVAQVFLPDSNPLCCVGNWCRVYPRYLSEGMWLSSSDNGLVAAGYGPSAVSARVGAQEKAVSITEETNYPFEEKVRFVFTCSEPTEFPLYLRVPGWCRDARIEINGQAYDGPTLPCTMVRIDRVWTDGDSVDLHLPMHIAFSRWEKGSVAIERGPLVFSLKIKEEWTAARERFPGFPDWEVRAHSDWNYALCFRLSDMWTFAHGEPRHKDASSNAQFSRSRLDNKKSDIHFGDSYFTVQYPDVPKDSDPWEYPRIELITRGKKVDDWRLTREVPAVLPALDPYNTNARAEVLTPDVPQSPVFNGNPVEEITLVPYGCTCLRLTYLPVTELPESG